MMWLRFHLKKWFRREMSCFCGCMYLTSQVTCALHLNRSFHPSRRFCAYITWGVMTELYSYLFVEVIDPGNYSEVRVLCIGSVQAISTIWNTLQSSYYSTLAFVAYAIVSFFFGPVVSTLSDSIGRKPVFILAAFTDGTLVAILGLCPSNWVRLPKKIFLSPCCVDFHFV